MSRLYPLRTRFQRDVGEIENYFETYSRRHPQVTCTMLRYQSTIGPSVDTQVTRYLSLPVVPDLPRLRPAAAVHPREGRGRRASSPASSGRCAARSTSPREGTIGLTRMIRLAGKLQPAAPRRPLFGPTRQRGRAALGLFAFSPDFRRLLRYGRGVDVSRLIEEVGFRPAYTMEEAVADYVAHPAGPAAGADRAPGGGVAVSSRRDSPHGGAAARPPGRPCRAPGARPRRPAAARRTRRAAAAAPPPPRSRSARRSRSCATCAPGSTRAPNPPARWRAPPPACRATSARASTPPSAACRRRLRRGRVGLRRGVHRVGLPAARADVRPLVAGRGDRRAQRARATAARCSSPTTRASCPGTRR